MKPRTAQQKQIAVLSKRLNLSPGNKWNGHTTIVLNILLTVQQRTPSRVAIAVTHGKAKPR